MPSPLIIGPRAFIGVTVGALIVPRPLVAPAFWQTIPSPLTNVLAEESVTVGEPPVVVQLIPLTAGDELGLIARTP
jgi:hypothetical protein